MKFFLPWFLFTVQTLRVEKEKLSFLCYQLQRIIRHSRCPVDSLEKLVLYVKLLLLILFEFERGCGGRINCITIIISNKVKNIVAEEMTDAITD